MTKVIHIHLLFPENKAKRDFYFGSIPAIYKVFDEKEIGIAKSYLSQQCKEDGSCFVTKRAIIRRSHLIRA